MTFSFGVMGSYLHAYTFFCICSKEMYGFYLDTPFPYQNSKMEVGILTKCMCMGMLVWYIHYIVGTFGEGTDVSNFVYTLQSSAEFGGSAIWICEIKCDIIRLCIVLTANVLIFCTKRAFFKIGTAAALTRKVMNREHDSSHLKKYFQAWGLWFNICCKLQLN